MADHMETCPWCLNYSWLNQLRVIQAHKCDIPGCPHVAFAVVHQCPQNYIRVDIRGSDVIQCGCGLPSKFVCMYH